MDQVQEQFFYILRHHLRNFRTSSMLLMLITCWDICLNSLTVRGCLIHGAGWPTSHRFLSYRSDSTNCGRRKSILLKVSLTQFIRNLKLAWGRYVHITCLINCFVHVVALTMWRDCLCNCGWLRPSCPSPRWYTSGYGAAVNDTDRGKRKNSGRSMYCYHFVHHKSRMECPRSEARPSRWKSANSSLSTALVDSSWLDKKFSACENGSFVTVFTNARRYTPSCISRIQSVWSFPIYRILIIQKCSVCC
jgi:hypothetical protein